MLVFHKSASCWNWVCFLGWAHSAFEVSQQVAWAWVIYDSLDWITQLSSTQLLQPFIRLVWALSSREETHECVLRLCGVTVCSYPLGQSTSRGRDESKCGEALPRGLGTDRCAWKEWAISVVFLHRRKERRSDWRYLGRPHWPCDLEGGDAGAGRSGHRMLVIQIRDDEGSDTFATARKGLRDF